MPLTGHLDKMQVRYDTPVRYALRLDAATFDLNPLLGQPLELAHTGEIHCIYCGRAIKKTFNQGYCFPCSQRLARCDICVVKPELCHFDKGTCREPDWGLSHCMQPHIVYLANSSGLKVGITREGQIPTRWIDQGATQALPVFRVLTRHQSGLLEVALAVHTADKTNWRTMLKGDPEPIDLQAQRDELLHLCGEEIDALQKCFGPDAITPLPDAEPVTLEYPVLDYPKKIAALNFDKTPVIKNTLRGIKGQYLIFDHGVLNIRKFIAYRVTVSC